MKAKITAQLVNTLQPARAPYDVHDTELRGFSLRVQPSGTQTYLCVYRVRDTGQRNRYVIGRTTAVTAAQARDEARKVLGDVSRGLDPNAARKEQRQRRKVPTLQEFLADSYSSWAVSHLRTAESTVARIRTSFPSMLKTPLDQLTAWQFDKWKAERIRGGIRPVTVNRELAALRSVLSKARDWELITEHPMQKVKLAKVTDDHRVRFLSDAEEQRLRSTLITRETEARVRRESHRRWREARHLPIPEQLNPTEYAEHITPMVLLSINTCWRALKTDQLCSLKIDQGWKPGALAPGVFGL
jgi:hypothetical protein